MDTALCPSMVFVVRGTTRGFVAAMLVLWISKTQKCVSQSTSEAEYLAMGDGVKKALPRDLFEVHRDFALGSR